MDCRKRVVGNQMKCLLVVTCCCLSMRFSPSRTLLLFRSFWISTVWVRSSPFISSRSPQILFSRLLTASSCEYGTVLTPRGTMTGGGRAGGLAGHGTARGAGAASYRKRNVHLRKRFVFSHYERLFVYMDLLFWLHIPHIDDKKILTLLQ